MFEIAMSPPGWINKERVATWNALVAKAVGDVKMSNYSIVVYVSRGKLHNRGKTLFDALTKAGFWEDDRKVASIVVQYGPRSLEKTIVDVRPVKRKWR